MGDATQPVGYRNQPDRLSKILTITKQNWFQNVKDLLDMCVSALPSTNEKRAFACVRFESRTRVEQAYVIRLSVCVSLMLQIKVDFAVVVLDFRLYFQGVCKQCMFSICSDILVKQCRSL